jgi:hypothetical protein
VIVIEDLGCWTKLPSRHSHCLPRDFAPSPLGNIAPTSTRFSFTSLDQLHMLSPYLFVRYFTLYRKEGNYMWTEGMRWVTRVKGDTISLVSLCYISATGLIFPCVERSRSEAFVCLIHVDLVALIFQSEFLFRFNSPFCELRINNSLDPIIKRHLNSLL